MSPKKHETETFARQIAERLDKARKDRETDRLYLIAPPDFLGALRLAMSDATRALVAEEVGKNLVRHDLDSIRSHLPERL